MWQIDCAINTAKAAVPFQDHLRATKHRLRPPRLTRGHDLVLQGAIEHLKALDEVGVPIQDKEVLEIGSGWFPILPLVFRAAGARRVRLTDAHRLLHQPTLDIALEFVLRNKGKIAEGLGRPESEVEAAVRPPEGLDFAQTLDWLGFDYLAPYDSARPGPPVDVVISHTVLEHIPEPVICEIFHQMKSLLKPGGVMVHGVDNGDHRSYKDPRLTHFDFLRYSDRVWRFLCLNPQDYTNRLRHSDYRRLLAQTGYEILREDRYVSPDLIAQATSIPLWGRFKTMAPEDLGASWSHYVARPQRSGSDDDQAWKSQSPVSELKDTPARIT